MIYHAHDTGLLLVDAYNDFISEGGQLWPALAPVARQQDTVRNMDRVTRAARAAGIKVFVVPHRRHVAGDYLGWAHPTPLQAWCGRDGTFARDGWGGRWHPDFVPQAGDVVAGEHWGSSGFANTDLDLLLKQRGIDKLILIGMMANTCIETTGRYAVELGYAVTLVSDATAAFSPEAQHAAHHINGPTYASAIVTTAQLLEQLPAPAAGDRRAGAGR